MKKRMIVLLGVLVFIAIGTIWYYTAPQLGGRIGGKYQRQLEASPNYSDKRFHNTVLTPMQAENASMLHILKEFLIPKEGLRPDKPLPTIKIDTVAKSDNPDNIHISWLGHSTVLLDFNGYRIITDPVFSKRTSPLSFLGTKQFEYTNNYSVQNLPKINAVLISHDHYDHLDYKTILALKEKVEVFLVPLGCKAHLLRWGVSETKIIEKDWGQNHVLTQNIQLFCTSSRHFSGRRGFDQNTTLWCSWVITANGKKIFYNGDSGYGKHFKEIGNTYGPFDLAFLECGQYNEAWPYIHMMPEETLQASLDLKAEYFIPIHWAKYKLSLHPWTEPIERLLKAAENTTTKIITPKIGENLKLQPEIKTEYWWRVEE